MYLNAVGGGSTSGKQAQKIKLHCLDQSLFSTLPLLASMREKTECTDTIRPSDWRHTHRKYYLHIEYTLQVNTLLLNILHVAPLLKAWGKHQCDPGLLPALFIRIYPQHLFLHQLQTTSTPICCWILWQSRAPLDWLWLICFLCCWDLKDGRKKITNNFIFEWFGKIYLLYFSPFCSTLKCLVGRLSGCFSHLLMRKLRTSSTLGFMYWWTANSKRSRAAQSRRELSTWPQTF